MDERKPVFSAESSKIIWYSLLALLVAVAGLALLLWAGLLCPVTFMFLTLACMIFPVVVIIFVTVKDEGWESFLQ